MKRDPTTFSLSCSASIKAIELYLGGRHKIPDILGFQICLLIPCRCVQVHADSVKFEMILKKPNDL